MAAPLSVSGASVTRDLGVSARWFRIKWPRWGGGVVNAQVAGTSSQRERDVSALAAGPGDSNFNGESLSFQPAKPLSLQAHSSWASGSGSNPGPVSDPRFSTPPPSTPRFTSLPQRPSTPLSTYGTWTQKLYRSRSGLCCRCCCGCMAHSKGFFGARSKPFWVICRVVLIPAANANNQG